MKIAFATQDLKRVDAHFGWAKNIAIYEIGPHGHRFLEAVQFDGDLKEDGNEDKLAPKIEAIKDCAILYVAAIGGSGAARVVANNIHPMKVNQPEQITDLLVKLEDVLKGTPPPWLRKAMLKDQERTLDPGHPRRVGGQERPLAAGTLYPGQGSPPRAADRRRSRSGHHLAAGAVFQCGLALDRARHRRDDFADAEDAP